MSAVTTLQLPPAIRSYVGRYVRRRSRLTLWRAVGRAIAFAVAAALASCAADRLWQIPAAGRATLLAFTALGALLIVARPLGTLLRRRVDWAADAADIEAHGAPFGESLMTVTSRVTGAPEHRGSDEMLIHLLREVDRQAARGRRARPVKATAVLLPWLLAAALLAAAAGLTRLPALGLSDLLVRFALPTSKVPPVTTTQIAVVPGDVSLPQGKPLRIAARVERLGGESGNVTVAYSLDGGRSWSRAAMLPPSVHEDRGGGGAAAAAGGGARYEFVLGSVDRDVVYFVAAGDATSREYGVRVLRTPAVAWFTVRYTYPPSLGRPPLTVTNSDGLLEAPAGTEAVLTVNATEPLQSAQLRLGSGKDAQRLVMRRAPGQPEEVREATLRIERDLPCELDLISARDVAGAGPPTMRVRAVPDRPPVVRLVQPTGSLRLQPRAIVPLTYEVLDDYGVESIQIVVQSGTGQPTKVPLGVRGDPRRQEGTHSLDLALAPLKIGDVVTATVLATDRAGQAKSSEPLQILVAPRSVDVDTHIRVSELASAAQMARLVSEELDAANAAADEADREHERGNTAAVAAALTRGNKHVSSAAETATLVRQSLLRAIVRAPDPDVSGALAAWIDDTQVLSSQTEDLFLQRSIAGSPDPMGGPDPERARIREKLRRLVELARRTREELKVAADGEQADAALKDRENLREAEAAPPPPDAASAERRRQTLRRAADEVAAAVKRVGLDPNQGDLNDRLADRRRDEVGLTKSKARIDFQPLAQEWSRELQADASQPSTLDDRLLTAAQAEAIRPGGELTRARDLHLAGRAAAAIAADAASAKMAGRNFGAGAFQQFIQSLAALEREHEYDRRPRKRKQGEDVALRNAAQQARQLLARYVGGGEADALAGGGGGGTAATTRNATPADRAARKRAEDLALRASAAAARHNYDESDRLDQELVDDLSRSPSPQQSATGPSSGPTSAPVVVSIRVAEQQRKIARTMQDARQIDRINADQDELVDRTVTATPESAASLAGEQQRVVSAISGVQVKRMGLVASIDLSDPATDPNWRSKASATVMAALEQLAAMPQRLGEAKQASDAWRDALRRAANARRMAQEAKGPARAAADRAARQMEQDAGDAEDRTRRLCLPVLPAAAEALADRLGPFAPETAGARDVVSGQLVPSLRDFQEAALAKGDDAAPAADRAAAAARTAIDTAQSQLALAQAAFTERDPLVAAKWFARAAAESLLQNPPDVTAAQRRQLDATAALAKAWDQTIHDAAAQRLGLLPSMQPLYAPPALTQTSGIDMAGAAGPAMPAAREWSRLRPRDSDATVTAPLRVADPPGYEDALKKYFESLGKAGDGKPR